MTNNVKFFSITSFEQLPPTGDGSKILVLYKIADDDHGIQNAKDFSIVIQLSRNAEMKLIKKNASFEKKDNQIKVILEFLRGKIKEAIIGGNELPPVMSITSYENNIPLNPDLIELRLGEWEGVIIVRKMGFLLS